jgi:hypothetical protein
MAQMTGIRFPTETGIFTFVTASRPSVEATQPPVQRVTGALSPGLKRPESEVGHSPPFSAEVKNA